MPPRRRRRSSPSSQIRRTDDGRGFCHFSPFFSIPVISRASDFEMATSRQYTIGLGEEGVGSK